MPLISKLVSQQQSAVLEDWIQSSTFSSAGCVL